MALIKGDFTDQSQKLSIYVASQRFLKRLLNVVDLTIQDV